MFIMPCRPAHFSQTGAVIALVLLCMQSACSAVVTALQARSLQLFLVGPHLLLLPCHFYSSNLQQSHLQANLTYSSNLSCSNKLQQ